MPLKLEDSVTGRCYEFPTAKEVVTIGRVATNDIVLDNPHISALHGQISCQKQGYFYQDLNSTNGSALERDGKRYIVKPSQVESVLKGDLILLGSESEPVIFKVIESWMPDRSQISKKGKTLVAVDGMAMAKEISDRLEDQGQTLVPFLSFTENLAVLETDDQAFCAFHECLGEIAAFVDVTLIVDSNTTPPTIVFSSQESIKKFDPDQFAYFLQVPLEDNTGGNFQLVVASMNRDFDPLQADKISLAVYLLQSRLRQMQLVVELEKARMQLAAKNRYLQEKVVESDSSFIGNSQAIVEVKDKIAKVANTDATILITGPSGSGKELVAQEIHRMSGRHDEIFTVVNCGALVDSLLETELFGCRQGAYSGAHRDREGLFVVAHKGTLFLDEIGDMSPALQVKLLRVLESKEVTPVGGTKPRRVDVRVLAATHRDLKVEVENSRFREDLFYRLNVFPIKLPPLAGRPEDIPFLAQYFLTKYATEFRRSVSGISSAAMQIISSKNYPGNVRELANYVQRAVLLAQDSILIEPQHILATDGDLKSSMVESKSPPSGLKQQLEAVEKSVIRQALEQCQQNRTHAAQLLGITRQALLLKLKKYDMTNL
jgi:transcriptional regulator with GAF, ATPase, and Fis domain